MTTIGEQESFENRYYSKEVRMAMQVGHSLRMIAWAAAHIESREPLISAVSTDIFLIHYRLLCEFLHVRPSRDKRDFSFRNLVEGTNPLWTGPTLEEISLLTPFWEMASSLVVHFSLERTPDTLEMLEPLDVTEAHIRLLTEKIFLIVDNLIAYYGASSNRGINQLKQEILWARNILAGGESNIGPWITPLT